VADVRRLVGGDRRARARSPGLPAGRRSWRCSPSRRR
jgi:hypothetical protein